MAELAQSEGEPNVRRWTEQRWVLDNVLRSVGIDWDQPRSFYLNAACGIEGTRTIRRQDEIPALRTDILSLAGLTFAVLKISPGDQPRTVPLRDGAANTYRFRSDLLGQAQAEGLGSS